MADSRPIGLFDSGIGGLTVLSGLLKVFPNESFVYLGDTARLPYGSKSPQTIQKYLNQNIRFLLGLDVKAVIVACNSASTVLLPSASVESHDYGIPVYNVIEPGARAAVDASHLKRIGILGTKATIASQAYPRVLHRIDPTLALFQQACPLLVPLVEEGWETDPLTNLIIYRYVQPIVAAGVDTLILGCTHYPALREGILRVTGSGIQLIDSSTILSRLIAADFGSGRLEPSSSQQSPLRILTTDAASSFLPIAERLIAPYPLPPLESVDIGVRSE